MFERFTKPARQVVVDAQQEARSLRHGWIGTEHLLLAVLRSPEQPGAATLIRLGVSAENCRAAVSGIVGGSDADALGAEDAEALKAFGIDLDEIRRRAENAFGDGALDTPAADPGAGAPRRRRFLRRARREDGDPAPSRHVPFTGRAKKALELSLREAIARKDRHIGVEHVVLALLRGDDKISQGMFRRLGVAPTEVRDLVLADLRAAA